MGLIETGIEVAKGLVPPKTNDLEEQQRWRWVVFGSIVSLAGSFALHIALACGWIPTVYPGFASAVETQGLQSRLDLIATLNLEHEIRSKTAELCNEKNRDRRIEINDEIAKLQREYLEIAKHWYPSPRCDQL